MSKNYIWVKGAQDISTLKEWVLGHKSVRRVSVSPEIEQSDDVLFELRINFYDGSTQSIEFANFDYITFIPRVSSSMDDNGFFGVVRDC